MVVNSNEYNGTNFNNLSGINAVPTCLRGGKSRRKSHKQSNRKKGKIQNRSKRRGGGFFLNNIVGVFNPKYAAENEEWETFLKQLKRCKEKGELRRKCVRNNDSSCDEVSCDIKYKPQLNTDRQRQAEREFAARRAQDTYDQENSILKKLLERGDPKYSEQKLVVKRAAEKLELARAAVKGYTSSDELKRQREREDERRQREREDERRQREREDERRQRERELLRQDPDELRRQRERELLRQDPDELRRQRERERERELLRQEELIRQRERERVFGQNDFRPSRYL